MATRRPEQRIPIMEQVNAELMRLDPSGRAVAIFIESEYARLRNMRRDNVSDDDLDTVVARGLDIPEPYTSLYDHFGMTDDGYLAQLGQGHRVLSFNEEGLRRGEIVALLELGVSVVYGRARPETDTSYEPEEPEHGLRHESAIGGVANLGR